MSANGINGHSHVVRPLKAGIYAPMPTFFLPDSEDLDVPTFEKHVVRMAQAGVAPVLSGSMSEAHHLTPDERMIIVKAARSALDQAGFTQVPIIAGTGVGSTRESIALSKQAAAAGADYAIVITSGYYAGALAGNMAALKAFFTDIADASPIPVMIYNYPGASGGINLDSDLITDLAQHPNICGVKLTCGDVGKLTRIGNAVAAPNFYQDHPRKNTAAPFLVLGGFADFILPSTYSPGHGAIIGLGNVAPYATVKCFELAEASVNDRSLLPEAQRVQGIVARGDFTIAKTGIPGTKFLLEKLGGYGGLCRKPLMPFPTSAQESLWSHPHVQELIALEHELSGKVKSG